MRESTMRSISHSLLEVVATGAGGESAATGGALPERRRPLASWVLRDVSARRAVPRGLPRDLFGAGDADPWGSPLPLGAGDADSRGSPSSWGDGDAGCRGLSPSWGDEDAGRRGLSLSWGAGDTEASCAGQGSMPPIASSSSLLVSSWAWSAASTKAPSSSSTL